MFLSLYVKVAEKVKGTVSNERGAVSMEWIMMGLLAVAVIGVVITTLSGSNDDGGIGEAIMGKISEFISQIGQGDG